MRRPFPEWLKKKVSFGEGYIRVKNLLKDLTSILSVKVQVVRISENVSPGEQPHL